MISKSDLPSDSEFLSPEEIRDWTPYQTFPEITAFKKATRDRMKKAGVWDRHQMAGKRWSIGCVSLEITQRCNLDCTLCYLSESSEAVKDIPLQEVFRRIDVIFRHYGPGTDVQISGGDPTLRKREELVQIVERVAKLGMKPTLFTNGILATHDLLMELGKVGLVDVAFHVDMTQERKGYNSEVELNEIRLKYIERARGTGVNVFFNTTVFADNFHEIPQISQFFCEHADEIQLASFQLQADTGRGVLRERDFIINQETVADQISKGAGTEIHFDLPNIGHPECNKYGVVFESNGKVYNFLDDHPFLLDIVNETADFNLDRENKIETVKHMLAASFKNPKLWKGAISFAAGKIWDMKWDLIRSKAKVNKITFFIHNFMDAKELKKERCESCVFMVATPEGPMSMCVFNAKRDEYILQKLKVKNDQGHTETWNPLTGETETLNAEEKKQADINVDDLPLRSLKGRSRKKALQEREKKRKTRKANAERAPEVTK